MARRTLWAALTLCAATTLAPAQDGAPHNRPRLDAASFRDWLAYIQPSAQENRWCGIPWRPQLWPALREAQAAERPVLVWAMNGHPQACT